MKYDLSCQVTVSAYTTVEANSLEEAIAIAEERDVVLSTPQSGADDEVEWCISDADGMAEQIQAN